MVSDKPTPDAVVKRLREALPSGWEVTAGPGGVFGACIGIRSPDGEGCLLHVDAPSLVTPAALQARLVRTGWSVAERGGEVVIVARYLSPEARRVLAAEGVSYVDLTGNLRIHTRRPAIFVQVDGADRNPTPPSKSARSLRGGKALAIVRVLCDFWPPLHVGTIARLAKTTPGHVSKLLRLLADEGLIEREPRGPVRSVAWRALVEARADDVDLLGSGSWRLYVPTTGGPQLMAALAERARAGSILAVTGGYATRDLAPVAATRLYCYTTDREALAAELPVRPGDSVGHVVLIEPEDAVVFARTRDVDGVPCVAPSQAAIDCLGGTDRMPEVGDALLDWMTARESEWRTASPEAPE